MLTKEIVNAIRGVYSSTVARDVKASKVLKHTRIRGKKVVECDKCGELFFLDEVTVHHVFPVIPPQITYRQISYNLFYDRLFCSWKNLQLLCLNCHQIAGVKEEQERKYWVDKKKQLVCRSKIGGKMCVNPIIDLKNLDPMWEVMFVAVTRGEADNKMRKWRKN
jgi:5-methylcytosine-specific restriction endonuclease McrA